MSLARSGTGPLEVAGLNTRAAFSAGTPYPGRAMVIGPRRLPACPTACLPAPRPARLPHGLPRGGGICDNAI